MVAYGAYLPLDTLPTSAARTARYSEEADGSEAQLFGSRNMVLRAQFHDKLKGYRETGS